MAGGEKEKLHSQWASLPVHNGVGFSMKLHFRSTELPRYPLEMRLCGQVGIRSLLGWHTYTGRVVRSTHLLIEF